MDKETDKKKGLDWIVNLNSKLQLENQKLNDKNKKLETELFFYKKSSDESKETISRILKKNNPDEMGYIFLNESARKFLKHLSEENFKMKDYIKNLEFPLNTVNNIEKQKRIIEDLQNKIDIKDIEIRHLKNLVDKNNDKNEEVDILRSKIFSLDLDNYSLKKDLLSKQKSMDHLQTLLKGFQSNLVEIFCDLYQENGDTFLNKLKSDVTFSECLWSSHKFTPSVPVVTLSNTFEEEKINILTEKVNKYKEENKGLQEKNKELEQTLDTVLNQINDQGSLHNKIKDLERQLQLANNEKESFKNTSCYFEKECADLRERLEKKPTPDYGAFSTAKKFSSEPYADTPFKPNNFQRSNLVCDGGAVARDGAKSSEKQTKKKPIIYSSISDSKFNYWSKDVVPNLDVSKSEVDSIERFESSGRVQSTQTSPQRELVECAYCFSVQSTDLLEAHHKKCKKKIAFD